MTKFQSIKYNEMNTFQDRVCRQIKEDIFFFFFFFKCESVAWEYVEYCAHRQGERTLSVCVYHNSM